MASKSKSTRDGIKKQKHKWWHKKASHSTKDQDQPQKSTEGRAISNDPTGRSWASKQHHQCLLISASLLTIYSSGGPPWPYYWSLLLLRMITISSPLTIYSTFPHTNVSSSAASKSLLEVKASSSSVASRASWQSKVARICISFRVLKNDLLGKSLSNGNF